MLADRSKIFPEDVETVPGDPDIFSPKTLMPKMLSKWRSSEALLLQSDPPNKVRGVASVDDRRSSTAFVGIPLLRLGAETMATRSTSSL